MKVSKVLESKSGGADVLSIAAGITIWALIQQLAEKRIGAFLVADDDGAVTGIVSERDVIRFLAAGGDPHKSQVREIMTKGIVSVSPDHDIHDAMDIMVNKRIRHLPVMNRAQPCGLITVRDLIQSMRTSDRAEIDQLVTYLQTEIDSRK